jgi:hypothetical protein
MWHLKELEKKMTMVMSHLEITFYEGEKSCLE